MAPLPAKGRGPPKGVRLLEEKPACVSPTSSVSCGPMKYVFSASGRYKRETRRGGVLGAMDTCAPKCARRIMSPSARSDRAQARKVTIMLVPSGAASPRLKCRRRRDASSDAPPGTVAPITACSCASTREVTLARMTACNINIALNVHLRDPRRP